MTLRCALQKSLNVPGVKVLQHVGIDAAMQTAYNMGIMSYGGSPGFFFSSRRRHTRCSRDWSSDVCSSDLTYSLFRLTRIAGRDYLVGFSPSSRISALLRLMESRRMGRSSLNRVCFLQATNRFTPATALNSWLTSVSV